MVLVSKNQMYLILFFSNALMAYMWFRVLWILLTTFVLSPTSSSVATTRTICETKIHSHVIHALWISFMEIVQILFGWTSSKIHQVFLFAMVRFLVESYFSILVSCTCWQHLATITCWSVGEVIRFTCFTFDSFFTLQSHNNPKKKTSPLTIFKTIRYQVSCVLFPIGATCELLLVLHIAMTTSRIEYYVLSCLWPMGFLPLMRRLLKQRANHTVLVSKGNEKNKNVFV